VAAGHRLFSCTTSLHAACRPKTAPLGTLHRLAAAILFIKLLFERLLSARAAAEAAVAAGKAAAHEAGGITLREAASYAYEASLAPIHTAIVKVRCFEQGSCSFCSAYW